MMDTPSLGDGEAVERLDPGGGIYHLVYVLCALVVIAFGFWAYYGTLDIVSMAMGEVVPSSQVKTVQHLEGGIVRKIVVREGERVEKNQEMVILAPTASSADVKELEVRLAGLQIVISRVEGHLIGLSVPQFDAKLREKFPSQVEQAFKRFEITTRRHRGELKKQQKTINQRRHAVSEIKVRIRNNRKGLKLISEQVAISNQLLKDNLSNRYRHLDLLKEEARLRGSVEEETAALVGTRSALEEAQASLQTIRNIFEDENRKEFDQALQTYAELSQRMEKFKDSLERTILRAPVSGIVKTLYVATIGGVVKPGEAVIDLVPEGDKLIIEAKLATQDIGYVENGQAVVIKLASADAARFGGLDGKVVSVSPDTLLTPEGSPYYKVRILTEKSYFQKGKSRYNLFPGMQVVANIQTGQRTILEYLMDPFLKSAGDALRER